MVLDAVLESGLGVRHGSVSLQSALRDVRQWWQDSWRPALRSATRVLTHIERRSLYVEVIRQEASHGYFIGLCSLIDFVHQYTLSGDRPLVVPTHWFLKMHAPHACIVQYSTIITGGPKLNNLSLPIH